MTHLRLRRCQEQTVTTRAFDPTMMRTISSSNPFPEAPQRIHISDPVSGHMMIPIVAGVITNPSR